MNPCFQNVVQLPEKKNVSVFAEQLWITDIQRNLSFYLPNIIKQCYIVGLNNRGVCMLGCVAR